MKVPVRKPNRRASTSRQRRQQHLLDVKVRASEAVAQRNQRVAFVVCVVFTLAAVIGGVAFGARHALDALFFQNPDYRVRTVEIWPTGT